MTVARKGVVYLVGSDFDFYEGVILRKRSNRRIQRMFAWETQYLPIQHLLDSSLRSASLRMTNIT